MPPPPNVRLDWAELVRSDLVWVADPMHPLWLRSAWKGEVVFVRFNPKFPEVDLYSLLVAENEMLDFNDFPAAWVLRGDLDWPGYREPSV